MLKSLIKQILTILIIYTPVKTTIQKIIIKRGHHLKKKSYIFGVIENIYWQKYFCHINDPYLQRNITSKSLSNGNGIKWAKIYSKNPPSNFQELNRNKVGKMSAFKANPIHFEIYKFIKKNNYNNSKTAIIQIGSCSGSDLFFFYNYFKEIKYISTDINNEILNFQRIKINNKKFIFYKCYAEEIDKCIQKYCGNIKNIVIFSSGTLQYVNPFFLSKMRINLSKIYNKKINLFITEPIIKFNVDSFYYKSICLGHYSFSHNYSKYFNKFKLKKRLIISPYLNGNDVRHFYSHYEFFLSKI